MSQVQSRKNISQINTVPYRPTQSQPSVASVLVDTLASTAETALREFLTGPVTMSTQSSRQAFALPSPAKMDSIWEETFSEISPTTGQMSCSTVEMKAKVVGAVNQLAGMTTKETATLNGQLSHLIAADSQTQVLKQAQQLRQSLGKYHQQAFTQELAQIVRQATEAVGFTAKLEVKKLGGPTVAVIGHNDQGEALLSELRIDPQSHQLDLVSETIGLADRRCQQVLDHFDRELKKAGVRYDSTQSKWTGGACWLTQSKREQQKMEQKPNSKEQQNRKARINQSSSINRLK